MTTHSSAWQAHLQLNFTRSVQGSLLQQWQHKGPLRVQRPFYPEPDGCCHVYILHPPGGVVGGDQLQFEAKLKPGSQALLTTPAAGKFYRSQGAFATQKQIFTVDEHSVLEWLPQENILFNGARLSNHTEFHLHPKARLISWEILCLGRPAALEKFQHGQYQQRLQVNVHNRLLLNECYKFIGGTPLLSARWGLANQPVLGTLMATVQESSLVDSLRHHIATDHFAVTQLTKLLICRYLGASTEQAKRIFTQAWQLIRPALLGKPACCPRVWAV